MSKQIYLHIPEPCHEDWNKMTPSQQGRFCKSCAKTVVDFSLMSDKEIITYLSKASGNTCGRFTDKQLERPMVKEIPYSLKPYKMILATLVPAFIISGSAAGQQGQLKGKVAYHVPVRSQMGATAMILPDSATINGKVLLENGSTAIGAIVKIKETNLTAITDKHGRFSLSYPADRKKVVIQISFLNHKNKEVEAKRQNGTPLIVTLQQEIVVTAICTRRKQYLTELENVNAQNQVITGIVKNEKNEALAFATVNIAGERKDIVADSLGKFSFSVSAEKTSIDLSASYTGYIDTTVKFALKEESPRPIEVVLKSSVILDNVTVTTYPSISCNILSGGVSVVKTIQLIDTANTFVQKLFNNEMFRAYPNPAVAGESVQLTFKKPGSYSIQLFDNAGKFYMQKELVATAPRQIFPVDLPQNLGKGIYYLKAIGKTVRKQFIDKLILK